MAVLLSVFSYDEVTFQLVEILRNPLGVGQQSVLNVFLFLRATEGVSRPQQCTGDQQQARGELHVGSGTRSRNLWGTQLKLKDIEYSLSCIPANRLILSELCQK